MSGRRPLWIVIAVLLLGALALWGASALAWGSRVRERPGTGAPVAVDVPGAEVVPALVPLAVLAVAAVAGVVALGGFPRRILGLVVAAAGAVPVLGAGGIGADVSGLTAGRALAVVGGLLLVAAGLVLLVRSNGLPRLGARYRSPGAAAEAPGAETDLWRALSEGDDPTVGGR